MVDNYIIDWLYKPTYLCLLQREQEKTHSTPNRFVLITLDLVISTTAPLSLSLSLSIYLSIYISLALPFLSVSLIPSPTLTLFESIP